MYLKIKSAGISATEETQGIDTLRIGNTKNGAYQIECKTMQGDAVTLSFIERDFKKFVLNLIEAHNIKHPANSKDIIQASLF